MMMSSTVFFILNISLLNEASTAAITAPSTKGALAI